jgi:prepilin-type N-terminal cleavage/methylation domain-containing protein
MTTSAPHSRRSAFTLVELLVVIGIMATLLVLVVPSFTGLGRGQSMRSATAQLRSTLALARQWAVTRNEKTYVIFPHDTTNYVPASRATMALRSYAVWAEKSGYISEWRYLPPGIIFDSTEPHPSINPTTESSGSFNLLQTNTWGLKSRAYAVSFPTNMAPAQNWRAISYLPNGRLNQSGGVTMNIFLREGWVDANTNSGVAKLVVKTSLTYGVSVEIRPLTGQLRVREK